MDVLNELSKEEIITVLEDYFKFNKRVFEVDEHLEEYIDALKKMNVYLHKKNIDIHQFSEFQRDLIILGFLNHLSTLQLDKYIKENITDDEMEKDYLSI